MAFPRKYQKVPLSARDNDDDVQLTALRKRVETAADDMQLAPTEDGDADSKQSMAPASAEQRYAVISNACNQILRHKRLPVGQPPSLPTLSGRAGLSCLHRTDCCFDVCMLAAVLKRAQLCVNGYRHKINDQMQPFTLDSLSDVSPTQKNAASPLSRGPSSFCSCACTCMCARPCAVVVHAAE